MSRVGMLAMRCSEDIMEAGLARNPPVLKGVFERLYSDATQRIQRRTGHHGEWRGRVVLAAFCRYGLIRQQMLLANKAYAAVVEAVASEEVLRRRSKRVPLRPIALSRPGAAVA